MVLEMAAEGLADRVALGSRASGITFAELGHRARRAGTILADLRGANVVVIDENSAAVPIALFGAALAGKPFVPLNYRLADDRLRAIVARAAPAIVIAHGDTAARLAGLDGLELLQRETFLARVCDETVEESSGWDCDPDAVAVMLFTSGTTGDPKAAVLRHRNLAAYLVTSVEFGSAGDDEAALVSVPPYHVAAVSSILSTAYAGRRVVYLGAFEPAAWVRTARDECVTHAMVVPTMLARILDTVEADTRGLPALRSLAYGGGPMPIAVVERALTLLPHVNFVNAYGLTETSSTIAVLGPEDHRAAIAGDAPEARARLGSVGLPLPGVELSIRNPAGHPAPAGETGEIWVRGEQVSGEYLDAASAPDDWFRTRDAGHLDDGGFLFVHGRLDDVIVRGGENLSPGEIEDVMVSHPMVEQAAVVGIPDVEWGERVVAAVVLVPGAVLSESALRDYVREELRSARTPERISFVTELPFNDTGKLLRRTLRVDLAAQFATAPSS